MSLKAFHLVFIAASIVLAFWFGGWSLDHYLDSKETLDLALAIGSFVAGLVLIGYGCYVIRKLRNISYL